MFESFIMTFPLKFLKTTCIIFTYDIRYKCVCVTYVAWYRKTSPSVFRTPRTVCISNPLTYADTQRPRCS